MPWIYPSQNASRSDVIYRTLSTHERLVTPSALSPSFPTPFQPCSVITPLQPKHLPTPSLNILKLRSVHPAPPDVHRRHAQRGTRCDEPYHPVLQSLVDLGICVNPTAVQRCLASGKVRFVDLTAQPEILDKRCRGVEIIYQASPVHSDLLEAIAIVGGDRLRTMQRGLWNDVVHVGRSHVVQ